MTDLRLGFDVPGGAGTALSFAIVMIAIAVFTMRASIRGAERHARALIATRAITVLLAWAIAVQPTCSGEQLERHEGRLALLFDASRSGIVRADDERTRVDQAKAIARTWSDDDAPDRPLDVYTFGQDLHPQRLEALEEALAPIDDDTLLGRAIESAVRDGGDDVGALVVVSDGRDLGGGALEAAERLGVRVHTIALGANVDLVDDAIAEVHADQVGFLRRTAIARVTLRRLGRPAGPVPVVLSHGDSTLREVTAMLDERGEATIEIPFTPDRLGRSIYRISILTASDDVVPENNSRAFLVRVARDNLRVLLVAGQPSWDQRFLRAFLTRDPATDLISFFILRNTSDMTMADPEELALIPFPTDELFHEHLGSFDVVLFQNFEYAPYQMAGYLPRIRDYVMRGGSFAMIGGPLSFSAAGYAETPIAEILPVGVLPRSTPSTLTTTTDRFSPTIAEDATRHPVISLLPDRRANTEAWSMLAPLEGLNVVSEVRSGGHMLLHHPTRRDRTGGPLPVLVAGTAGRGRVLALMTDTSWRWGITTGGLSGDASAYERFWDRTLRWLARDPALEPARLATDRERYGPGARVRIEADLADERYIPLAARDVTFSIASEAIDLNGMTTITSSNARTDSEGHASTVLEAPSAPDGYRVMVRLADGEDAIASDVFVVEAGGDELADPRPDPELLRALATSTGGVFFEHPDRVPALSEFDASRVRSLGVTTHRPFASAWALIALVACFGGEWIIRRRWGAR